MIHLEREPAPDFWDREHVKKWTQRWLNKGCESAKWAWPHHQGRPINAYARESMRSWHYGKCAFCESPLTGKPAIEHFYPKTPPYALRTFIWRNLFLICPTCNSNKGAQDPEDCIKPDCENPADYLWVNPTSLCVEPKPGLSPQAQHRAETTISLYGLDQPELTDLYREYLQRMLSAESDLHNYTSPEQPFSLMTKCVSQYYDKLNQSAKS